MSILIIGVGNSGSNIVDRIAKENLPDTNYLKVNYLLDDEPIDKSIPLVNLNTNKATSYPTNWSSEAIKGLAEKEVDAIRDAIVKGLLKK